MPSDPLFGNAASDLLRDAVGTGGQPPTDPRFWEPPAPEELQAQFDGYLIEAFLARGGMGAVYRGIQTSLERPVAIKILPPSLGEHDHSFLLRFKQEARAMAQLNHPGIVKVYDFGEMSDGTLYFIMEFIDGTDVARMVASQGRLSSAHAMAITAHVCDALQYAHEHGIVHRDIKPANIMVGHDGRVKVADFGLAKSIHGGHTSLTVTGHVMGTVHFVAPEALTLGSSVDHRADIYAMGVMLYQMLTGRLPQGIFEMPSLLVKGLDPRYDAIIAAAMREDRAERYQAIHDMRCALDAVVTKPVTRTVGTSPRLNQASHPKASTVQPMKKRRSGVWWASAAIIPALGALVFLLDAPSKPSKPDSQLVQGVPDTKRPPASVPATAVPPSTIPTLIQAAPGEQTAWLEKAAALATQVPEEKNARNHCYKDLSLACARLGRHDQAVETAKKITDADLSSRALIAACAEIATQRQLLHALEIAREPAGPYSREARVKSLLASVLLTVKDFQAAADFARQIDDPSAAALFLADVAALCHDAGDLTAFHDKVRIASMHARALAVEADAREVFKKLCVMLVQKNELQQALDLASYFRHNRFGSPVIDIIGALAQKGDFDAAGRLSEESAFTMYPGDLSGALIAHAYADRGDFTKAESIAKRLSYEDHVARALCEVQVKAGRLAEARASAAKLLSTAHMDGNRQKAYGLAFAKTAVLQARTEGLAAALKAIESESSVTARMLSYLALVEASLPEKAPLPEVSAADAPALATLACPARSAPRTEQPVLTYGGHRYQFVERRCAWEEARDAAAQRQGYLAVITSQAEHDWLVGTFKKHLPSGYESIFLGGIRVSGAWQWCNGEPFTYTGWNKDEPADKKGTCYMDLRLKDKRTAWCAAWNRRPNTSVGFIIEWDAPATASTSLRTFTDTKGRQIRASLLRVQNQDITLKREDGLEFTLQAATLSEADIVFLKTKGLAMPAAGQPVATTTTTAAPSSLWKNRCTAAERIEAMGRTGGSPYVEDALGAVLHYLKAKQNPNGSWGAQEPAGKTALALLAYLGRCETMESKDFGDSIIKGIMFLIETGKKNSRGALAADAASSHAPAEHAMATEALAQMYLAARSGSKSLPGMREAFENGIRHIIQSQATASGSAANSLLTLAWQAEALNTARLTKLKFDGLNECLARLALLIKQAQKPDGSFSGQATETQRAITGACLRALQILPGDHQAAIAKGIQFSRQHYQKEPLDRSKMDLHAVFFLTRAFFRQGGDDWKFWNQQMLPQVLAALKPDGSISCPPSALMPGDDIDNTAMAALTLETYFRDTPK
jgi:serine/threonine protein kinase